jgi:hypothetical protein
MMNGQDALQDIHSIAFAARNQIRYWQRFNISPDVGSLKIALEGIIDLCEKHMLKEDFEEDEEEDEENRS